MVIVKHPRLASLKKRKFYWILKAKRVNKVKKGGGAIIKKKILLKKFL